MFKPNFSITGRLASILMELEGLRQVINLLPIGPRLLTSLRESAQLESIHYSTMIEGNRLTQEEITKTLEEKEVFIGRERDQKEVWGYYQALAFVEKIEQNNNKKNKITEEHIKKIHSLVMNDTNKNKKHHEYRTVQNVIREGHSGAIVYLPPESADVPLLMKDLVTWLHENQATLPTPIIAAIAHYQFATVHPYIDGNGRTARLLTTLILRLSTYDLKGIYSLDHYYAQNLPAYYEALAVGPSHNYYMGRAQADITSWIEYFCAGMLSSFEKVKQQASQPGNKRKKDHSSMLRKLDTRQRMMLSLFQEQEKVTSHDVEKLLKIGARAASMLCLQWIKGGFLIMVDPAKKSRKYGLAPEFYELIE